MCPHDRPQAGELYKKAAYRLWLPPGIKEVKGIIFRQHGCGTAAASTGLDHANDLQWQALAQKHGMALMGSQLEHTELCAQWTDLESGSERAFLQALKNFSRLTNHPELTKVPWALYGHSGGAYWCTKMLHQYPERILAVINRSGGIATDKWKPEIINVPVLWAVGEYDTVDSLEYIKGLTVKSFAVYRRFGAPWALAIDPQAGHENRHGRSFYIPYLDALLSIRLSVQGYQCRDLDSTKGWLGNWKTKEIFPSNSAPVRNTLVWLPTKEVAEKWKEFVSTGWVTDYTSPPPPENITIQQRESKRFLVWEARTDEESGLKQFNIYKDGRLHKIISGQATNHGDVGQPATVDCHFELKEKGQYAVSITNHQGLESAQSVTILFAGLGKSKDE